MPDNPAGSSATAGATTTAPVSASASLERAAAAASSPASAPDATSGTTTPAAGTGHPGSTEPAISAPAASVSAGTAQPATSRDVPLDRHEAAVRNARVEAVKPFAWAANLQPNVLPFVQEFAANPPAFIARLTAEIEAKIQQTAGRQPSQADELPQPDLVSEDGRYKTYSDTQLAKFLEARDKRLTTQILEEMRPMREFADAARSHSERQQVQTQAEREAGDALTAAKELPHFWDNRQAIAEKLAAMDPEIRSRHGAVAAMYMAYNAVLKETVLPGFQAKAEQTVRDEYKRKATATGSVNPASPSGANGTSVPTLRNQTDVARHMERLASQAN